MFVICVARHGYLSEHLCSVFGGPDVETAPAVGFDEGIALARERVPDVVICDYDLFATAPLDRWEGDDVLAAVPVVAVSMTRRPEEAHLLDINGIAGFLYLPSLGPDEANAVVQAAVSGRVRAPVRAFQWGLLQERRVER